MRLTCDEATANLADAKAKLHKMLLGDNVVGIGETDKRIDKARQMSGDRARLEQYVNQLQRTVDGCNGVSDQSRHRIQVIPVGSNDC